MTTATEALPSARDAEQYLVGMIANVSAYDLEQANQLADQLRGRVVLSDFSDLHCRAAMQAIFDLRKQGESVSPPAILQLLSGNLLFKEIDPFTGGLHNSAGRFLGDVAKEFVTTAHLEHYLAKLSKASIARRFQYAAMTAAERAAQDGDISQAIADLRTDTSNLLREIDDATTNTVSMFDRWAESLLNRTATKLYTVAPAWSDLRKFQVAAGRVALIGAPPGSGKTALTHQMMFDALRAEGQEDLRILILSVEVPPADILTRQLARLTQVGLQHLIEGTYDPDAEPRIRAGMAALKDLLPRIDFVPPPFTLERLQTRCDSFDPQIVLADYVQRIDHAKPSRDARAQSTAAMDVLRQLAMDDRAVLAISAVSRQKGSNGSTYASGSLGMASFRESSELEYGADSAWLLLRDDDDPGATELRCVKNRQGELASLALRFDGSRMEFKDDQKATEWKFDG